MSSTTTFSKVGASEKALFGPRKLLLCGFGSEAQAKFAQVAESAGVGDVPQVVATAADADTPLAELMAHPGGRGAGEASELPRAIIVGGIREAQLIRLMSVSRQAGMRPPLWACLTPVSQSWPLARLLAELAREHAAMQARRR